MKYVYATPNESGQTISDSILHLEGKVLMSSERPEGDWIAGENGEWLKVHSVEAERQWRNEELKLVASQEGIWKYVYRLEMEAYMQLLADYPSSEAVKTGSRPSRPKTPSGHDIIL